MTDIKWIKITTDVFDDEKIRLIESLPDADTVLIIWFKLLSMAGKCNDRGLIYLTRDVPYNDEMLSTIMRRPVNTIRLAVQEFMRLQMITIVDDFIQIINWEKHQNVEGMERVKELRQARNKRYYDKKKELDDKKLIENEGFKTSCKTEQDTLDKTRLDKTRLDKTRKDNTTKGVRSRFVRPSPEKVQEYIDERGITAFTGQEFCDSNDAKGWVTGKNNTPIKDWKAVVRTWERFRNDAEKERKQKEGKTPEEIDKAVKERRERLKGLI